MVNFDFPFCILLTSVSSFPLKNKVFRPILKTMISYLALCIYNQLEPITSHLKNCSLWPGINNHPLILSCSRHGFTSFAIRIPKFGPITKESSGLIFFYIWLWGNLITPYWIPIGFGPKKVTRKCEIWNWWNETTSRRAHKTLSSLFCKN